MMKLGQKVSRVEKLGAKALHAGAKFGAKAVAPAAAIASAAMPEVALPLALGAEVAKPLLKSIQRQTR
jgi:hypothetical protein